MKRLLLAAALSSCGCVARGSRVRVPRGEQLIEDLAVGDEIICVDPDTGEEATGRLAAVRSLHRECVRLNDLTLTSDHPVYCPVTREWAPAGDWALGKRTVLHGVELSRVEVYAGVHEVFDLTVDHPLHNFVANGVLVHNKSQSTACKDYIACCARVSGASNCSDSTFGAMGTCWNTTTAAADSCIAACKASNDSYKSTGIGADAGCTF